MSGPLAPLFAQVRKMLDPATRPLWEGVGPKPEHHGLDALSAIERHVQDMEKSYPMTPVDRLISELRDGYGPGHTHSLMTRSEFEERIAQFNAEVAALPAREKEEE